MRKKKISKQELFAQYEQPVLRQQASTVGYNIQPNVPIHQACVGCSAREEQLVFLREQVRTLQDKLLCLVPEAADRAHRIQLTQQANMRPEVFNGVVPLEDTMNDDQGFGQWFDNLQGLGKVNGGRNG